MSLLELDADQRAECAAAARRAYEELKAKNLDLNLTRGKPSTEQLDLSRELLSLPGDDPVAADGTDVRNYGQGAGIIDIRSLWAEVLGIDVENLIAADSSSLNIMFDLISFVWLWGTPDSPQPWGREEKVRWICPVPGYDRHFTITEKFGIEMVPVPMLDDGPDMDAVRNLAQDPTVKGMWTVPVFGNPTGVSFSKAVTEELASMDTAAPDFRIVWDNAYAVHTLTDSFPEVYNVIELARQAGNPNRFWFMSSTSKITHAGSGVSFFASSKENLEWYQSIASVRGIGPNKVNQLAHARFFGSAQGVFDHMKRHAESLAPKFQRVQQILDDRLSEYDVAHWTKPDGGYFISLDVVDGTASRVVQLAKEAGIALTQAGSSFPLHEDPNDRNIRLAPSMPPLEELEVAMDGVATCVLVAALEKLGA
ncbi:aminotransferase [Corynebacterium uberis]|uniref:aminotransferase n=1 Tax=Corynebacterium uberis TaxID=2883169 RepID=UPI0037DCFE65